MPKHIALGGGLSVFHTNAGEAHALHEEIFVQHCYAHPRIDLQAGDTVIDIGANIGMATMYFHRRFPKLKFVCIEPLPSISDILLANLEHHRVDAVVVTAVAADYRGTATLTCYPDNTIMSGLHADPEKDRETSRRYLQDAGIRPADIEFLLRDRFQAQRIECQAVTLSDIIRDHHLERVDLVKIDVEKSEMQVLRGIESDHWPRIRRLCVEVHDIDGRLPAVISLLQEWGFTVEVRQQEMFRRTELHDLVAFRA